VATAPPRARRAVAAAPPQARWAGSAAPPWARRGGGTSSLPRFLDGSLDTMHLLEEGEALGFTSW
jgi:hypothetical protein